VKRWLPAVTAGRYTDVTVNPTTLQVQVCGSSRRWRTADLLSYGTAEQVYLLLRVALADHLTRNHGTCPLMLDDVTVHADSARTRDILGLLLKIAEERQVIIFTQEEQVAAWAREHLTGPVGLDYSIWPGLGQSCGLRSSLNDLLGGLPARVPSARLSDDAGAA
jgi:exonuclease SbcC